MIKILIADDDNDFRWILKDIIEGEGYTVADAPNGAKAFELFKTFSPDLVCLDLQMPEMDGLAVTKAIRELDSRVPIILLTGYGAIPAAIKAGRLEILEFIPKPPNFDNLLDIIETATEDHPADFLNEHELQVLNFLKEGKTGQEMTAVLEVPLNTVSTCIKRVLRKLKASGRAQAVAKAIEQGIIPAGPIKRTAHENDPCL